MAHPEQAAKVHSLLVANFNYGDGCDPRKRGEMFGTGTAEGQDRLTSEGHGAIATYDLYRLIRSVQREEDQLGCEDLQRLLETEGIFNFDTFIKSLEVSVPNDSKE